MKGNAMKAADLLLLTHPLHRAFVRDCNARDIQPSKRAARKFLQRNPFWNKTRHAK